MTINTRHIATLLRPGRAFDPLKLPEPSPEWIAAYERALLAAHWAIDFPYTERILPP